MSASSDLQSAIAALLTGITATVGDGSATSFPFTHDLGILYPTIEVKVGNTVLTADVDYAADTHDDSSLTLTALLGAPAQNAWAVRITPLSAIVPVIARVSKSLENDIAAAVNNQGLAISVMPIMPEKCDPDYPFVFIERGSIRVRIIEKVQTNRLPVDAYQLRDDVMTLLHYRPRSGSDTPALGLGAMLSDPLRLSNPPAQMMFESGAERVIDVIFNAVLQLTAD